MTLALMLGAGFALGMVGNIYALGLAASGGLVLVALLALPAQGASAAGFSALAFGLMLQLGFGGAVAVRSLWARRCQSQAAFVEARRAAASTPLRR